MQFIEEARNVNRTVGAMLSGELIRRHPEGLPDQTIFIQMEGTGGQSFGAFLAKGITLYLIGDANDYTGKGLSGGRVVVRPSIDFRGDATKNIIVGNTVLYGATSGEAFFRGVAGERFAVRLSGATAVVEGTGDHGCEYMTGGTVVVLGKTGRNFAAGMSGGIAYVYDEDGQFASAATPRWCRSTRCCRAPSRSRGVDRAVWHREQADEALLKTLIDDHHRWTGSLRAREILDHWAEARAQVRQGVPERVQARARPRCTSARPKPAPAPTTIAKAQGRRASSQARCRPSKQPSKHEGNRASWAKSPASWSTSASKRATSPCPQRVKNYKEFVIGLKEDEAKVQGARCMDCGTPFCNSGCPVNNIIPDFNDLVYRDDWKNAFDGAALDQQLPRVHRPHLPRAVRGGLHAERQRRPGRHQVDRARDHRPRLGRRLGAAAAAASARPARRSRWSAPARPAWPPRSSWRAPATT